MARIAVFGAGLVGRRVTKMLAEQGRHEVALVSHHRPPAPVAGVEVGRGWAHPARRRADIVVLTTASAHQSAFARRSIDEGIHVVTTADGMGQIERLRSLDRKAADAGVTLVVGAAYSPGVSTVLARHLAGHFDQVHAIRTAQFGTGGPACARSHHRAMGAAAREVRGSQLRRRPGGSGRELIWFPEPVGPVDCYRAGLPEPVLLHDAFPDVDRIESRQAATRRDRLTSRSPMLRSPHAEGLVGGVWTEVRGTLEGRVEHRAMAATGPQATGAAVMAALFCGALGDALGPTSGSGGMVTAATIDTKVPFLKQLAAHLHIWAYDGSEIVSEMPSDREVHAARKWKIPGERPGTSDPGMTDPIPSRVARTGTFA